MPGENLERHRRSLWDFSEILLADYIDRIQLREVPPEQKEFNDPVWQTIALQPFEVVILDSPLLQRLRLIRQLGVVHWVYPGATHTRFEHTLGVVHQVQSLISAINRQTLESGQVIITAPMTNLLRLIALCHDIGHGLMSHVSENAAKNFLSVESLVLDFEDKVKVEKAKPSEMAAYYIVEGPAFSRLLRLAREKCPQHQLPEDFVSKIQDAIVGKKISDSIPLLHELINGPFDADKLDYMPRDARMAGVPVVTDIPRLIKKVRAAQVKQEKLPHRVASGVLGGLPSYWITGIALSGGQTLDELMLGRALLFDKIYRHQKVRAAESMIAAILECLSQLLPRPQAMIPYALVDDQLINLDIFTINSIVGRSLDNRESVVANVALDIAKRLRERQLFVRSFAFSQHMPLDPYRSDTRQRAGLEALIRDSRDPQRRGALVRSISDEVIQILKLLKREELLKGLSEESLRSYIWIDPPEAPSQGGEIDNAHLIAPSGEILRFKEETAEARGWTDAYPLARDLGFIFTTIELSPYVFLAAEREVRESFGVRIPRSMVDYAKQSGPHVERLRRDLASAGYYEDANYDISPIPLRLLRADVQNRLTQMAQRLRGYVGPFREESVDKRPKVGLANEWERIRNWLRQFDEDEIIEEALSAVERTMLIGRPEIIRSMKGFLDENKEFHGGFVCPLGGPKDSSSVYTYLAGDVQRQYGLTIESLEGALGVEGSRPILFVEDFVGSGKQAVTILESMLGERLSYDLSEVRQPLNGPLRQVLRERRLGFAFAAGMKEGVRLLRDRARDLGIEATVSTAIEERDLPVAFSEEERSPAQERFRSKCIDIGRELLNDKDPRHTEEWIESKVLGYGNRGFLVVFAYNTPAQTLTCLWAEGTVGKRHWSALFPRRKKP